MKNLKMPLMQMSGFFYSTGLFFSEDRKAEFSIKWLGLPTKLVGQPTELIGAPIKNRGNPTKTVGLHLYLISNPVYCTGNLLN